MCQSFKYPCSLRKHTCLISNGLTLDFSPTLLQIAEVTTTPADRSAEALSLAVALETSGLVHFVVRRAAEGDNTVASRDHTIVYKGTREVNGTSSSSSPPQPQLPPGGGAAEVLETVEGLEPNATYEVRRRSTGCPRSWGCIQRSKRGCVDFNPRAVLRKGGPSQDVRVHGQQKVRQRVRACPARVYFA